MPRVNFPSQALITEMDLGVINPSQRPTTAFASGIRQVIKGGYGYWQATIRIGEAQKENVGPIETFVNELSELDNYARVPIIDATYNPHRHSITSSTTIVSGNPIAGFTLAAAPGEMEVGRYVRITPAGKSSRLFQVTSWSASTRLARFIPMLPLQPGWPVDRAEYVNMTLEDNNPVVSRLELSWGGPWVMSLREYLE